MEEKTTSEHVITKEEVLRILKEENPKLGEKYTQYILIIEHKRLSENLGIIKGELYKDDMIEYRGSLLIPNPKGSDWEDLEPGKSRFHGVTFDTREKGFSELIGGFFKRTLEEGKLQDLIPK